VFAREGRGQVLIGKDTRISGYLFESALEAGLSAAGVDVRLLGPMPTPAIAYLTRTFHANAGIVISASHNPYYDNGVKFFGPNGHKLADDIERQIEAEMTNAIQTVDSAQLGKATRVADAPGRYIEFCKSTIRSGLTLEGMNIVVDCANGATYHIAPRVFDELGAKVTTIGASPDGCNINEGCGSTHTDKLRAAVLAEGADVGVALDGDGDRIIMIDHNGETVDGDEILFVIAESRFQEESLHGTVVGTVMSNLGLEHALRNKDIDFKRTDVGDRNIIDMLLKGGWTLGGESSGHIICLDRTTTGDGIVSALQVLSAMQRSGRSLHDLKSGMTKYPQALINVPISASFRFEDASVVTTAMADAERSLADKGRILLRASGTEPVLRVMVEGEDAGQVDTIARQLAEVVTTAANAA
jgi:phosphoglucosamine mutase